MTQNIILDYRDNVQEKTIRDICFTLFIKFNKPLIHEPRHISWLCKLSCMPYLESTYTHHLAAAFWLIENQMLRKERMEVMPLVILENQPTDGQTNRQSQTRLWESFSPDTAFTRQC